MKLSRVREFIVRHLLPSLVVGIVSLVVVLSVGLLQAAPGTFDTRKSAAEEILKGRGMEVFNEKSLQQVSRTALTTSFVLTTLFFALTYVSMPPGKK